MANAVRRFMDKVLYGPVAQSGRDALSRISYLDEGKIDIRIAERVNGREVLHDVLYLTPAQALYLLTYLEQHRSTLEEAK